MTTYRAFLGLGSNIGERQKYLNQAAAELHKIANTKLLWTSSVYETEPYGKKDQPKFLNAVVEMETQFTPVDLLAETQSIEQRMGRTSSERWGPRQIDIDILLYDGLVNHDGTVTVPHPELDKRKFVLVPFCEIAPDVVHPISGLTVEEMARACNDQGRVVRTAHKILF
jgi:2-amino-4-hydroxy-6-hydroxymethyldihydropteridine diphosphokinase